MGVPNAGRAVIDLAKLRDYCLNPLHPRGRHKARVFRTALGFTAADAAALRGALLPALPDLEAKAGAEDEYGSATRRTARCRGRVGRRRCARCG